jgi:xylulose-5-phosphate/fructose-6-phosphate phosphoketolase
VAGVLLTREIVPHHTDKSANGLVSGIGGGGVVPARVTTTVHTDTTTARRYRRAADYLAAAMIYLRDNVLLRERLRAEHLKPRLLGHWGTYPGITFLYTGLNGLVARTGQRTLLVTGPGHGAPANHANLWLEGTHGMYDPAP